MAKDDLIYVGHMLDQANSALDKVRGKTRADFDADEILRLALVHLVQTVGEAARRVQAPFRERYPGLPWAQIVGMRHRIVHDYLHVDERILWDVVTRDLPDLVGVLESILSQAQGESPAP